MFVDGASKLAAVSLRQTIVSVRLLVFDEIGRTHSAPITIAPKGTRLEFAHDGDIAPFGYLLLETHGPIASIH